MHRLLAEAIDSLARGIERSSRPEDRKLVGNYLAALAPVLARAVLGQDILRALPDIDRLFDQTRLVDSAPFDDAFSKWRAFKAEYSKSVLGGMTVNERLSATDQLEAFDRARAACDQDEVRRLLRDVLVDETAIERIVRDLNG
ncbi:MAG TPA: hypothetical protein VHG28_17320 [Longimicrobiaceae bacterium]|nr:hypothetical protein [Longimicrobiaceae bacterium]